MLSQPFGLKDFSCQELDLGGKTMQRSFSSSKVISLVALLASAVDSVDLAGKIQFNFHVLSKE